MYTGHIAPWRPSGSFGARRRGVGALKGIETHGRTEFCQSCRTRPSCVDSPLLTIRTSSDFVKDRIRLCSDPSKALTGLVCAMQAALAAPSAFAWRAPTATHSAANAKVARVTVCRGESGEASECRLHCILLARLPALYTLPLPRSSRRMLDVCGWPSVPSLADVLGFDVAVVAPRFLPSLRRRAPRPPARRLFRSRCGSAEPRQSHGPVQHAHHRGAVRGAAA